MGKRKNQAKKKRKARAVASHRGEVMLPPPLGGDAVAAFSPRDTDIDLEPVPSASAAAQADDVEEPDAASVTESGTFARDTLTDARRPEAPTEHRAAPRVPVALEVDLHLASDSHFFSGLSGDISEGGLFVSTYRALAIGCPVEVAFSLPGGGQVTAHGEVRWQRVASPGAPPGVGIAFDHLGDDERVLIQRFCSTRPPLYYDDVG